MRLLTEKEKEMFEKKLIVCDDEDEETGHGNADEILCDILRRMGYRRIVRLFERLPKWYS